MRRLALLTLATLGLSARGDPSPTSPADTSPPALGKTGAGDITITSIGPSRTGRQAEDANDAGQVVGSRLEPGDVRRSRDAVDSALRVRRSLFFHRSAV